MTLYFEDSNGKRRAIAYPETDEEAWEEIRKFCEERDYDIPYVRSWTTPDGEKVYDVGSWTEFMILVR